MDSSSEIQKKYYANTADNYDAIHGRGINDEHDLALHYLSAIIKFYDIKSVLDVGAGTGRTVEYLLKNHIDLKLVGVEPVDELREKGYEKGIPKNILIKGDGNSLIFNNNSFDLVCEFGVLHHIPKPEIMIAEMIRVGKKGIFISDCNNFGNGSFLGRSIKQTLNTLGLWKSYNYIRTRGKNYQISEGDGLFYSYSVFNNFNQIKKSCKKVLMLSTKDSGVSIYRSAPHVSLLGLKN